MMTGSASQKGFTLVEVLVALTILAVGMLGVAGLAGTAMKSSGYSQGVTQANNLAQEKLEALLAIDYNNIQATDLAAPSGLSRSCVQTDATVSKPVFTCTPTATNTLGNRQFTWSYTVTYLDLNGDGVANPNGDGLKEIKVTVSWTDQMWHTTKSVIVTTLRAKG